MANINRAHYMCLYRDCIAEYDLSAQLYNRMMKEEHMKIMIRDLGTDTITIEEEEIMKKVFSKSYLKTGMMVQLRDGSYLHVFLGMPDSVKTDGHDIMHSVDDNHHTCLVNYRTDLTCNYITFLGETMPNLDVMKVWEPKATKAIANTKNMLNPEYGNLIWEREEPKDMTVAEIEEILGFSIRIKKED